MLGSVPCHPLIILLSAIHKEGVNALRAFCPDFSLVLENDALGNGKAQAEAAAAVAGLVCPIKPPKEVFQILLFNGLAVIGNR